MSDEWIPRANILGLGENQVLFLSALRGVFDRKEPGSLIPFRGECFCFFSFLPFIFFIVLLFLVYNDRYLSFPSPTSPYQKCKAKTRNSPLKLTSSVPLIKFLPIFGTQTSSPWSESLNSYFFFFQISECEGQETVRASKILRPERDVIGSPGVQRSTVVISRRNFKNQDRCSHTEEIVRQTEE